MTAGLVPAAEELLRMTLAHLAGRRERIMMITAVHGTMTGDAVGRQE